MQWNDFKAQLSARGLTQADFSRATGYNEQIISRWKHRKHGCPKWVATWLSMYRGRKRTVA